MSRTVIQVEGLGKRYCIGQGAQYTSLRNLIGDALRAPARRLRDSNHNSSGQANGGSSAGANASISASYGDSPFIWTLKDVSCEVKISAMMPAAACCFPSFGCEDSRDCIYTAWHAREMAS